MSQVTTTRSGRIVKKPERYEPVEQVTDDYNDSDYDSGESDYDSDIDSICTESTLYEDDVDEEGNLKDFVVDSESESDEDEDEEKRPKSAKMLKKINKSKE